MKAVVATAYGDHNVLQVREIEKPQPKENEVIVRIMASAATTADTMMLTGKPLIARLFVGLRKPKHPVPGTGFAGIIDQVGENVSRFRVGDRVFGETTLAFGTNAEFVAVPENGVMLPMPENLPYEEAANFCDGHLTSYNFLKEVASLVPGQRILINGASGSLGTSAIQIAKYFGAHVTGVCSGKNTGLVKSLGADEVIDYQKEDFTQGEEKYDFVYDTVGKSSFRSCKPVLKEGGVYLSPVLKFSLLLQMILTSVTGSKKAKFEATGANSDDKLRGLLTQVMDIYHDGKLKTIIDRQFPLEKLAEAHRYIAGGHKKGNVVIVVGE